MTVIVAVTDPRLGRVFLGSDTLCESGDTKLHLDRSKWAIGRHWAIGLAGHLRYNLLADEVVKDLGPEMTAMGVANRLRDAVRADGAIQHDDKGQPAGHDLSGLITDGRAIWNMDCSYAPLPAERFAARGIGREFATGAMWAACKDDPECGAQKLLMLGVGAAIENCRGCGGQIRLDLFPNSHR